MEPVGLRSRVGLLEGGELMLACGDRLMRLLVSSAPDRELDEEFKRKEKRS